MRPVNDADRLLNGLEMPAPPERLRARAVAAARAAAAGEPRPDLWTRLWVSVPLRLAWAATVAGLVLAHLTLSLPVRRTGSHMTVRLVTPGVVRDAELAKLVELPRISSNRLPHLDVPFSGRSHPVAADERRQSDGA